MKKVKKVKRFVIVELNPKEQEERGFRYAVIDPDLYTGDIGLDIGCFEFDGIDSIDEAIEKAASL